jgi:hypothetical protein
VVQVPHTVLGDKVIPATAVAAVVVVVDIMVVLVVD